MEHPDSRILRTCPCSYRFVDFVARLNPESFAVIFGNSTQPHSYSADDKTELHRPVVCSCNNVNGVYQPGSCTACPNGVTSSNGQYICASAPQGTNSSSPSVQITAGGVGGVVQGAVGVSDVISCTPVVGNLLDTFVPWLTEAANFVSSLTGNSCG